MSASDKSARRLRARLSAHLEVIYGESATESLVTQLVDAMRYPEQIKEPVPYQNYWDQADCWLIAYATSIRESGEMGLPTLRAFCDQHLAPVINGIHVLPFYPFSSDDGFAVIDYLAVDDAAGTWEHVDDLASSYRLMADLVINHASSQSQWFQNFIARKDPGQHYFKEVMPQDDLSQVVRPRSTPLRQQVATADGERWVWCTFGPDQVDLDFGNTDVLLRFVEIIRFYLEHGVRVLRLDAVAFLWKEPGTTSLHDQKTHEVIKLLRTLIEFYDPSVMLITETNVPNRDNITYFGNSNEAHAIYNFSLPPLLIYTLLTGNCKHLKTWLMSMPPARLGTAYLNFIASHDGIGLRPVDGLLSVSERAELLDTLTGFGGKISLRTGPDGAPHPYEVNISLIDALAGTVAGGADELAIPRLLCAHAIMLALEGIPAIYIHSLLGTPNDVEGVARTGQYRSINRRVWERSDIEALLDDPSSTQAKALGGLRALLEIRRRQAAFHPNAIQFTLQLGLEIFGVWRQSMDRQQDIFCINNVSDEPRSVELENINLVSTSVWRDLISGAVIEDGQAHLELAPYQSAWLTNSTN
ncbi:MAG: sugar phosphorylase [Gammaproteobacteria bacterium]